VSDPLRLGVVALCLALLLVVLRRLRIPVVREAASGAARTILQLLIMGSILLAVFRIDRRGLDAAMLFGMVAAAAFAARRRARDRGDLAVTFSGILLASAAVILPMTLLGVFERRSSFLIPLSGMVIGNAMNAAALSLERLRREMELNHERIEALIALGFAPEPATDSVLSESAAAALIPVLNSMKTTGLVHIPGLMTGMLITGSDPLHAAQMQAVIIYLIFIGAALSSVVVTRLQRRRYFTSTGALRT